MGDAATLVAALGTGAGALGALSDIQAHVECGGADAIIDAGGGSAIARLLESPGVANDVATEACYCLEALAAGASQANIAALDTCVASVVASLARLLPEGAQAACLALSVLPTARANKGAVACAIVAALQTHGTGDVALVEAAGAALASIAVDAVGQAALADSAAIPLLVRALSAHAADAAVAEHVAAALCAAAVSSPNQAVIAREGGIPPLLLALGAHADAPGVAETCCTALANIASHADGSAALVAHAASEPGAAAAAVLGRTLVLHHAAEPVIVRQVRPGRVEALELFGTAASSPAQTLFLMSVVATAGGAPQPAVPGLVGALVTVLKSLDAASDTRLCVLASGAVQRLTEGGDAAIAEAVRLGAIEALVALLKSDVSARPAAAAGACAALFALAAVHAGAQASLEAAQGLPVLIAALGATHAGGAAAPAALARPAAALLCALAFDARPQALLGSLGCVAALVSAMRNHAGSADIVVSACPRRL